MNYVKSENGDVSFLVETKDKSYNFDNCNDRNTIKTGIIKNKISDNIIKEAKKVINSIANEFGDELTSINPNPKEVEMEFELSFSSEASAWVLSATGSSNIKVRIKWEK